MLLYIEGTKIRNKTKCTPNFKMQWEALVAYLYYGHSPSYRWLSVNSAIRNNLNFSHAVCFTSVISDVNMDREFQLCTH